MYAIRSYYVSILYGSGQENPDFREAFVGLPNLKFLKQGIDPKTFVTQHKDVTPDLVLVDLDGFSHVPDWLEQIINDLPDSEIMICSQSRDPRITSYNVCYTKLLR